MTEPVLTVELAQPQRWPSANDRTHYMATHRLVCYWQDRAAEAVKAQMRGRPPFERVRIQVTLCVPTRRRLDPGNYASPLAKALIDGATRAGLVEDDDWRHVVGPDMRHEHTPNRKFIRIDVFDLTEGDQA